VDKDGKSIAEYLGRIWDEATHTGRGARVLAL
jgi:hypothetical protein